jgi:phosphoglycolate phosphatase-like HAD superfamily hydrolase
LHHLPSYNVYIFDCDGVILDSNQLKINAMENALIKFFGSNNKIDDCIEYFKKNFGTSRFHHVEFFVNNIFMLSGSEKEDAYEKILLNYSAQCRSLYLLAELTPGVLEFITKLKGKVYIASGSEQNELRAVFKERNLEIYFQDIYGSPTTKVELVAKILQESNSNKALMFGDALSDMYSAFSNSIDFVAYLPYSNVRKELELASIERGFPVIYSWRSDT